MLYEPEVLVYKSSQAQGLEQEKTRNNTTSQQTARKCEPEKEETLQKETHQAWFFASAS